MVILFLCLASRFEGSFTPEANEYIIKGNTVAIVQAFAKLDPAEDCGLLFISSVVK